MQTLNFDWFTNRYSNEDDIVYFYSLIDSLGDINEYGWLAGGAIRRLICGHKLDSDFDFFFKSKEKFEEFYNKIKENKDINVLKEFKNQHNITLSVSILFDSESNNWKTYKLQLININYYNTLEDVLNSFDYTLCMFGLEGTNLVCGDSALWDLGRKKIVINKITYPVASLRRLIKYTNQNFYACDGCLTGLLNSVKEKPELLNNDIKYID